MGNTIVDAISEKGRARCFCLIIFIELAYIMPQQDI